MANLIIDDKTYDIEQLPEDAKAQVTSLQFVERELQQIGATVAVYQTARNAYLNALRPYLLAIDGAQAAPLKH